MKIIENPWGGTRMLQKSMINERNIWQIHANTLWLFNIAMDNGPFIDGLLKMVIFHGYVK